ncbi:MAG: glycosyltransferase family 1 protein [Candidatus Zixiibacteriota bacterium]
MRIGIDASAFVGKKAGTGVFVEHMVKELSQIDTHNHYVLLYIYFREKIKNTEDWGLNVNFTWKGYRVPSRVISQLCLKFGFPTVELLAGKLDIFHSPSHFFWPQKRGKKMATVHDLIIFKMPQLFSSQMRKLYQESMGRIILNADLICADSFCTKTDIIEMFRVPESKVRVVYGGVDQCFKPLEINEQWLYERFGIKKPFILFVGVIEPRKNLEALVKAYENLSRANKIDHHLVIAGKKGWLYEPIIHMITQSEFRQQIFMLDYVRTPDLVLLYNAADLFVYPSLYEGFGLPVLEAMACGTPVVASPLSSLPEVAGDAAWYVDPHSVESIVQGIETALNNEGLREELSRKGLERSRLFSWRNTASQVLELYQSLG